MIVQPTFRKIRNQDKVTPKEGVRKNRSPWGPLADKAVSEPGTWYAVPADLATEKRFATTAPLALTRYLKRESLSGMFEFGETTEGGIRRPCVRYLDE